MGLSPVVAFVTERHGDQKYGALGYVQGHLARVVSLLYVFGFDQPHIINAGWCHDVVEDTPTTIEEVRERFGEPTAAIVWAVTSEPGKNRKERNAATYPKIRAAGTEAVAVKLCDRIANVEASVQTSDSKLQMYRKEYPDFRRALRLESDGEAVLRMWDRLDTLLGWKASA